MKPSKIAILIFIFLGSLGIVARVSAVEYDFGLAVYESVWSEQRYLDRYTATFQNDRDYNFLSVTPSFSFSTKTGINGYARAYFGWTHDWTPEPYDENEGELLDAYIDVSPGHSLLRVGMQPLILADGFLTSVPSPGVRLKLRPQRKTYIDVMGGVVLNQSPMAGIVAGYNPDFFEKVEIFGYWFQDQEDSLAEMLRQRVIDLYRTYPLRASVLQLQILSSQGDIFWAGGAAELFVGDIFMSAVAMGQFGGVDVFYTNAINGYQRSSFDSRAFLADVGLDYTFNSWLSGGPFFFMASGDKTPLQDDMTFFFSPMPYNTHALIFFDPEFFGWNTEDVVLPGGGLETGVLAPGIKLRLQATDTLSADFSAMAFFPESPPETNPFWYGWEADAVFNYEVSNHCNIYLNAGVFFHGDFFKDQIYTPPDQSVLFSGGVRYFF